MKKNRKRGFSITEVVIAMAVIAVASFSAVSVLTQSNNAVNNARLGIFATNDTYNLLECFKTSKDFNEFDQASSFAGYTLLDTEDGYYLVKNLYYVYEIRVNVNFEGGYFYALSYNVETGRELCTVSFSKG